MQNKTILIVEDDNLTRTGLANALAEEKFKVIEASDGKKGLAAALANHPDLIVTDLRMPEMDGQQMTDEIRKDEWGKTTRIIILSAEEGSTAVNEALKAGVTTYLSKSNFNLTQIIDQIKLGLAWSVLIHSHIVSR